jgi:hypothetical protein
MPKRPSKERQRDTATGEALRRINKCQRYWNARKLDLSDLKLSRLPEAIGQLSRLQELNLSGNGLSTLPGKRGKMPSWARNTAVCFSISF